MTHTQSAAYYAAVLSATHPGTIKENEKLQYYEPMIDEIRENLVVNPELSDGVLGSEDEGDDVVVRGVLLDVPVAAMALPPAIPPVAAMALVPADAVASPIAVASDAESSSSSSSSSSDSDAVVVVAEPAEVAVLAMYPELVLIGAYVIRLDDYVDLIRPSRSHVRYQITCLEHGHRCKKRRGVGAAHERRHGRAEPIAFFVWRGRENLAASPQVLSTFALCQPMQI